MPVDVIMQKVEGRLVPATHYDAELIDSLPVGKEVRCKITVFRSDNHQRWYWVMLAKVVENTDMFCTSEALHFFLKVRTGTVSHIKLHNGETVLIPKSTGYGKMDQTEFKKYTDSAIEVICNDILPGTIVEELMGEVNA